jgi:hypothetical protein
MDGYLIFNFDDTINKIPFNSLKADEIPEGSYIYCFTSKKWFLREDTEHRRWHDKQTEDVPKQHRADLLIYS